MAEKQRVRLLLIKDYLETNTDPEHPISLPQLQTYLENCGAAAERKALYRDIDTLVEYGMDIEYVPRAGYYVGSRKFALPELKLLADAVQSSRFLTKKKSSQLIEKLASMTSRHESALLRRQISVAGRVKTMNESIYYNVDAIHEAIDQNRQIQFTYTEWGIDRKRHPRPGVYIASPYALCWAEENYYLIAHSSRHGLTHYRVDKMQHITALSEPRIMDSLQNIDLRDYDRQVFQMYNGQRTRMKLRFHNSLAGVVIDRFGADIVLVPDGAEHFLFTTDIAISPIFMGWLAGLGTKAAIVFPQAVKEAYLDYLQQILKSYDS